MKESKGKYILANSLPLDLIYIEFTDFLYEGILNGRVINKGGKNRRGSLIKTII